MWNPWGTLRRDHPNITVKHRDLSSIGCLGVWRGDVIYLEETCNQAERRCTLTHELVHVERGPVPRHPYFGPKEERKVEALTAERLITLDALIDALVWNRNRVDHELAEELWVDLDVLTTRVRNLTVAERAYIDQELERRSP